mmetsp:Transcript_15212/g.34841  ORF Transcript_15212/g.34841 Transcript_15212/m.34841 type:complete len:98 (-) Transcript_15212:12-305(-)
MIFRNLFSTNVSFNKIRSRWTPTAILQQYISIPTNFRRRSRPDFPVTSQLFQQTPTNDEGLNKILGVPKYLQQKNSELRNSTLNLYYLSDSPYNNIK